MPETPVPSADPNTAGGVIRSASTAILASAIRTFVPILVALGVRALALAGISIDNATVEQAVTAALSIVIALAYYVAVRALETFKSSRFGWLLGFASTPIYATPNAGAPSVQVVQSIGAELHAASAGRHAAPDVAP